MASLDNIYDIKDKLEESGVEYLLIAIQKGKKMGKADVFFNLLDKNSLTILAKGLSDFQKKIEEIEDESD